MPDHCPWPLNKLFLKCMILDVFSLAGSYNPVIPDTKQLQVPTSSPFPKDCSIGGCESAQQPSSRAKAGQPSPHPKASPDNEIIIHLYLNAGGFLSLKKPQKPKKPPKTPKKLPKPPKNQTPARESRKEKTKNALLRSDSRYCVSARGAASLGLRKGCLAKPKAFLAFLTVKEKQGTKKKILKIKKKNRILRCYYLKVLLCKCRYFNKCLLAKKQPNVEMINMIFINTHTKRI